MKLSNLLLVILVGSVIGLTGCGKKDLSASSVSSPAADALEAGITSVSGIADDQNGSTFAMQTKINDRYEFLASAFFPKAYALGCSRAVTQACSSGVRTITYADCEMGARVFSLSGSVTLTYSSNSCAMISTGDSVTRTYDYTISGPHGGSLTMSSANHFDYRGNTIGGGGKLTRTSSGYDLDILGKHKVLKKNGSSLADITVRTIQPLEVTGGLARAGRQVNNGILEVNHNLSKFTARYTASNLVWSAQCCHPTSGTMSVTYTGSLTGSATVTFDGCGTATLEKDGTQTNIDLSYCE